jgi:4-hydroxy-2-oxoheptanedioate aldolase
MDQRGGLRATWQAGKAAIGAFIFTRLDPVAMEALGRQGYDYIVIDMQHGLMGFSDALAMLQALSVGTATPIVRVAANDPALIGQALDAGALGVIVPMVNTAEEAARAVAACRYAPEGSRSFGAFRASIAYGADYHLHANARVLCIPMVETVQALDNIEAIAAVPGVSAIYVGPNDLSLTMGLPAAVDNGGAFPAALARIVSVCRAHGVVPGIHANVNLAAKRAKDGFQMITVSGDLEALLTAMSAALATARTAVGATQ